MESTIIASLIGAGSTIGAASLTHFLTKRNYAFKHQGVKDTRNIAHRKRNYRKTKRLISLLLSEATKKKQIPDLHITNLGTPVDALSCCEGYDEYQEYLQTISKNGECVVHRYHIIQDDISKKHIQQLKENLEGITNANLYITKKESKSSTVVNYLVFSNLFAAVTLETAAKIQVSFHTRDQDEILGVKEFLIAMQSEFTSLIREGRLINGN